MGILNKCLSQSEKSIEKKLNILLLTNTVVIMPKNSKLQESVYPINPLI